MSPEEIKELNDSNQYDTWNQGVFVQPNHIPVAVKEPVVYMRWNSHGYSGGSCWDDSDPQPYENSVPDFEALHVVCKYLNPDITLSEIKMIESLCIEDEGGYDHEYYGNETNYTMKYILLSDVEKWINKLK